MKKLIYSISILLFAVIFCNAQWVTNGPNDVINSLAGVGTYTIAGGNSGVYISTNNGGTWTIGGSLPGIVQVIAICNSYIYAGLSGQGLYRSTDYGTTWISSGNGFLFCGGRHLRQLAMYTSSRVSFIA